MAYLQMREDCRVLHQKPYGKLFWNSNYNLDLRHACKRRQFDDTLCEDLSEACFWDLGMKNKLKGINGMQMELLKMMYHSVTECYVYVYIKCLSFQVVMVYIACVELPVRQNDSVENIPQSEALVESSVVCQEVVIKQHSIVTVCSKHFKPSDTEVRDVSMQQTTDVEGKKFRNLSPNGLKWFNGAVNIPLHICRKLLHSAPTAFTHLYNDIVHQTSLSAKDLTNCLFTFSMPRFRGPTYIDVLLNKIGQDQTELECLGSGLSGTDVKKNGSVKAKYKKDGTKNGKTDKTGHAKLDHERAAGGNVEVDYMNKASFGTKPREILPLKTGTHNLPGYK
ncbi:uncharacterized protein LOC128554731, partial [Mercenaria mercenaria]|uniref:uncharacterized protein LOC128554731 n=1 Tax=Mercenaria mercenaria TaxID=6596 RepID=UPI00234EABF6